MTPSGVMLSECELVVENLYRKEKEFLAFGRPGRSGKHLGGVLEASWSCLRAAAATDAAFDGTEAVSKRSWIDL